MAFVERRQCVVCRSEKLKTIVSTPYSTPWLKDELDTRFRGHLKNEDVEGAKYEVAECGDCGLLMQRYLPDDELSMRLYDLNEGSREQSLSKEKDKAIDRYIWDNVMAEMAPILVGKPPGKISLLDFGSGWGRFLKMAQAHGMDVAGVEIMTERRKYSQEIGLRVVENLSELGDQKFDFIQTDQTLEHITEPLPYLQELARRLSQNGVMYIGVPDCKDVTNRLEANSQRTIKEIYPLHHINGFKHKSLVRLAEEAGLTTLSPIEISSRLTPHIGLSRNGHLLQEAIKTFYKQTRSTGVYFVRNIA